MRASIPNTEQLEMSENNDIKEEKDKYASGHVEISAAARYKLTETGRWNREEAKRKSVVWKTDTFQQEEEEK